jgi:hypothetical protein
MNARDSRQALHTGGCQCGAVRYALYAPPKVAHLCHCRMCQKAVGGPFAALAPVRLADFSWTRGTPATFQSSAIAARDYCAACGTPLSFRYLDGKGEAPGEDEPGCGWIDVTIGSLDQPADVPPVCHYGAESKVPWLDRIQALPGSRTDESMDPGRRAQIQSLQHPDEETPAEWRPIPHGG